VAKNSRTVKNMILVHFGNFFFFSQCSNLFADFSELCFYIKMKSSDRPACRKFENILKICYPHCSKVFFFTYYATFVARMDSIFTKKESVQYFRARSAQSLARLLAGATTLKSPPVEDDELIFSFIPFEKIL